VRSSLFLFFPFSNLTRPSSWALSEGLPENGFKFLGSLSRETVAALPDR